jgi:predicted nucleic acid-binding protein
VRTAVDSSVLLDVLGADPGFGAASREALRSAYDAGALVACDIVWAEVRAHYASDQPFEETLALLGVQFDATSAEAARLAGHLWREYRDRTQSPKNRLIPDFLIGSHAIVQADELLSRDRGFYRSSFAELRVIDPSRGLSGNPGAVGTRSEARPARTQEASLLDK